METSVDQLLSFDAAEDAAVRDIAEEPESATINLYTLRLATRRFVRNSMGSADDCKRIVDDAVKYDFLS